MKMPPVPVFATTLPTCVRNGATALPIPVLAFALRFVAKIFAVSEMAPVVAVSVPLASRCDASPMPANDKLCCASTVSDEFAPLNVILPRLISPTRFAPVPLSKVSEVPTALLILLLLGIRSVMLPASVPVSPDFPSTLAPPAMAMAMSSQLRFAPLAVAVNVVVPPALLELTPTLVSNESVSVNAGEMRASSGSMDAILDSGARRVRAPEDWVVFIEKDAGCPQFFGRRSRVAAAESVPPLVRGDPYAAEGFRGSRLRFAN